MHALQARSPWARSSPVLSGSRGNTPLRRLTRHARAYKGAHCSQDFHTHNRDNPAARPFDDPHKTPPPRPAAAAAHQHHAPQPPQQRPEPEPEPSLELPSSLSTSDLEFGADAITGSTLETPEQLAHKYRHPHQHQRQREREERLHQADIAREAAEAREAAQGIARLVLEGLRAEREGQAVRQDSIDDALFMSARDVEDARLEEEAAAARAALAAGESTAAEREERYAGVMQALDSLGASDTCGASDDEGQALSPDAARMTASDSVEHEEEAAFDTLRHTVDMLGEGDEAAELIMESYKGRNLEAEALSTLDPSDTMPHPGDRYLRPSAARAREPQPGGMEARLNSLRSGPDFESRRGPPLAPARGAIGSRGQQPGGRRGGGSAWMPPEGCSTAPRSSHDPVEDGGEAEARGGGHGTALTRAGADGPRTGAGAMGAGSADDQIGLLDAWRHDGPVGADPAGSAAGTADDQIDFEQDILRGADAMYYAPEHAATPAVNADAVGGSGADAEAPEGAYDVEGDALQGGDAMFYFKSPPSPGPDPGSGQGSAGGTADGGARPGRGKGKAEEDRGTVQGALSSRDEQDRSFRNATHDAAAAEASGQLHAKDRQAGTGGAQPLPAEVAEPRSAQPPDAALNKGPASAASSADGGPFEGPYQQGMPSSLRRQQGERREAERRLEGSPGRLQRTREPGDPEPPPPLVRVVETALGRSAALGLCAALSSELLTQQSVLSQLLGRYEGSLQIELARSSSQAAALAVLAAAALLTIVERTVSNSQVPRWRVLGLSPTAQVWLGRSAMLLFALLLAYETVHSNRPAFSTLFYLWP